MEITDIKKHVTHLSEEIRHITTHMEEIVVGGKVTQVTPSLSDKTPTYILVLDDIVGVVRLFVGASFMRAFSDKLQIGEYVFIEAYSNIITRNDNRGKKKDVTVYGYNMKDITEVGDTK